MYKGEPTNGIAFYNLLFDSEKFTSELGKVALASGKLEAELILFLTKNGIEENLSRANLGKLIIIAEKNCILEDNEIKILKIIKEERNYITHNIYALFIDLKDETILEKKELLDSDVLLYIDRAWQLKENLNDLAELIRRRNSKLHS